MATLKQLRLDARLSISELSRLANVDRKTVDRAETGNPVQEVKIYAILDALSQQLGRKISIEDIEGLQIW